MQKLDKQGYLTIEYKELEFTAEELDKIKTAFENIETIEDEDIEKLKKDRIKSGVDSITLGKLFMDCYNYLREYTYLLSDKDDEEKQELEKKLNKYLDNFQVEDIRSLIEEQGNGKGWGSYNEGIRIRDLVKPQRTKLNKLIELFFKVFGEE